MPWIAENLLLLFLHIVLTGVCSPAWCISILFSYRDDDNKENYPDNTAVLEERQLPLQDTQQHKQQALTVYTLKPEMGNLKLRKPKPVAKVENGKSHEESQVKN